ncbi:MAG: HlyD family type I secretion periplasmic adaptor subunit [Tropicimonas sp.]|uniref:HlyD family type I secretion periplasmic adaptor subunit n=1 Tax=Tropicimonas sp. TaxID=2067044 RepID=UPI003A873EA4
MTDIRKKSRKTPDAKWPVIIGLITLTVLVAGLGSWAVLTRIAGAVVTTGQIEVASQQQVVQHADGGVVEVIHVADGDWVEAGQLLITLDGTFLRSELSIIESQFFEILARRGRLEAERNGETDIVFPQELASKARDDASTFSLLQGQTSLFRARAATLRQRAEQLGERKEQITSQIAGIDAQITSMGEQISLNEEELIAQEQLLSRGLTPVTRVLALRRQAASLTGDLGALQAQRAEALGKITEINLEIINMRTIRQEEAIAELRDLGYREIELAEQRRVLAERIARLDIRAPVSGVVHGLQVTTPRSVLRSADAVGYLVPQDQPLVISALIQPQDISNVYMGQQTNLRFPAFSTKTTPEVSGVVTVVSADAFQDNQTGQSFYKAQIMIAEGELDRLNGQILLPGMPVEVMLMTKPRTPMAYLIKPLADYFATSFRES